VPTIYSSLAPCGRLLLPLLPALLYYKTARMLRRHRTCQPVPIHWRNGRRDTERRNILFSGGGGSCRVHMIMLSGACNLLPAADYLDMCRRRLNQTADHVLVFGMNMDGRRFCLSTRMVDARDYRDGVTS